MENAKENVSLRRRRGRPKRVTVSDHIHSSNGNADGLSTAEGESERRRVQLDLSVGALKRLDALQAEVGFSRADTIRVALAMLRLTCEKHRVAGEALMLPAPKDFQ